MSLERYHQRVTLSEPFSDQHVTVLTEPPMRLWIASREAVMAAMAKPSVELLEDVFAKVAPVIIEHDLTSTLTGELLPTPLKLDDMSIGQVKGLMIALRGALLDDDERKLAESGESADPLPSSPKPSSPTTRSRRSSRSSPSP